jgi:Kef-type K+ transport system membrane component KefB
VSFGNDDTAHLVPALALLLVAAHAGGWLFARLRQPRVIGEIAGGLVLGPTVLGALVPHAQRWLFPVGGPVPAALGAVYQLGLLLLMFAAGLQVGSFLERGERRLVLSVAVFGTALPFAVGLAGTSALDLGSLAGPAGSEDSLVLVLSCALAVTSIPVIARIMLDHGLLRTWFARVVLSAAVLEDLALYAVLAIAVGISQTGDSGIGLRTALGLEPASLPGAAYYVLASSAILAAGLALARPRMRGTRPLGWLLRRARGSVALQLIVLFAVSFACLLLDVVPVFGGLIAGIALSPGGSEESPASATIAGFSLAFFVPIYFALVGFRLDLASHLDLALTAGLVVVACVLKGGSVYLGARMARQPPLPSRHLAVAMNARGGPGIVLASISLDAGIINQRLYVALVLLAIVTSLLAGGWLRRAAERDRSVFEGPLGTRGAAPRAAIRRPR